MGLAGLQYRPVQGLKNKLPGDPSRGAQAGAYVTFDTRRQRQVVVRIGLSTASVAGARRNLAAESDGRSFAALRAAATARWERMLGLIQVSGETPALRTELTSMLYRSLLMPSTISDVDGAYGGMDGHIHHAHGFTMYSNISGWDIYRSEFPLLAMIDPRVAADLVSSMTADQHQSGFLPKWPVLQGQNDVMVGDPADALIAEAERVRRAAISTRRAALAAMVHGATVPGVSANAGYVERQGLSDLLADGFVPYEDNNGVIQATYHQGLVWGSASTTLEDATEDFAIARLAAATGNGAVWPADGARIGGVEQAAGSGDQGAAAAAEHARVRAR